MFAISFGQSYVLDGLLILFAYLLVFVLSSLSLGRWLARDFSRIDRFLIGAALNFAVIIIPSIPIGTTTSFLSTYLKLVFVVELMLTGFQLYLFLKEGIKYQFSFQGVLKKPELFITIATQPFVILITILHPVLYEWDYVVYYGTYYQSIVQSGMLPAINLVHNLSSFETWFPPGTDIFYYFLTNTFGQQFLPFIPYLLYLLFLAVAYRAWSIVSNKRIMATWLMALCAISPIILVYLSLYSLYPDMLSSIFVTSGIIYSYESGFQNKIPYLFGAGLCGALALLTKDTSIFILPMFLICYAYGSKKKLHWTAAILFLYSVILVNIYGDIFTGGNQALGSALLVSSSVTTFLIVLVWHISKERGLYQLRGKFSWMIALFAISMIGVAWYIRNFFVLRSPFFPLFLNSSYRQAYDLAFSILQSSYVGGVPRTIFISFYSLPILLRYDLPFDLSFVIGTLFFLEIIGTIAILRKRKSESLFAILGFLLMIFYWQNYIQFATQTNQFRHLIPFLPFLLMIPLFGLESMFDFLRIKERLQPYFFSVILILFGVSFGLITNFDTNALTLNLDEVSSFLTPSIIVFALLTLAIVLLGAVMIQLFDKRSSHKWISTTLSARNKTLITRTLAIAIIVFFGFITFYEIFPSVSIMNASSSYSTSANYQLSILYNGWNQDYEPVVAYYLSGAVPANAVTIAWYDVGIAYYTHHKVIDLRDDVYGYMSISDLLFSNDSKTILQGLEARNITYFMIPNSRFNEYDVFQAFEQQTPVFFNTILDTRYSHIVEVFPYLTLYELQPISSVSNYTLSAGQAYIGIPGIYAASGWTQFSNAKILNANPISHSLTFSYSARTQCCLNLLSYNFIHPQGWQDYTGFRFNWSGGSNDTFQIYIGNSKYTNGEFFYFHGSQNETYSFSFNNSSSTIGVFDPSQIQYLIISTSSLNTTGVATLSSFELSYSSY
jgi:hypothetical protein